MFQLLLKIVLLGSYSDDGSSVVRGTGARV